MDICYIPRLRHLLMPVVFAGLLFLSSGFYSVGHAQSFQVAQIAQLRNWEQRRADGSSAGGTSEDEVLNDAEVLAAQANQLSKIEVTAVARVKKLLPDDTRGLQHQKFLLILSNGSTVLVANDLSYGQRVPVQPGSVVRIHGEYVWNKLGGLIHWTHRSDTPRHEGGWIEFAGTRYQ